LEQVLHIPIAMSRDPLSTTINTASRPKENGMKPCLGIFVLLLLSLLLCAQPVAKVRIGENVRYTGHVLKSSANETWVLWDESVTYGYEIRGQKYDSLGNAAFDSPISIVSSDTSTKLLDAVASSDTGLVLLFMQEDQADIGEQRQVFLKVQKLNSLGQRQWTDPGLEVATVLHTKFPDSKLCANNLGGAFLIRPGFSAMNQYVNKLSNYDASGNNIWTADNETDRNYSPNQLLLTDAGDLIMNLYSYQSRYLRKVDNNGNTVGSFPMFPPYAVIPAEPRFQKAANGNILIYSASFGSENSMKMQMMDASGNLVYSTLKSLPMGMADCNEASLNIELLFDGGFILAYNCRAEYDMNLYGLKVQRLSPTLDPVLGYEGPLIFTGDERIIDHNLAVDSSGQAWLSMLRSSPNYTDMQIELVKLNPNGSPAFTPQLISSSSRSISSPRLSLFTDKAMLFWSDYAVDQIVLLRQIIAASGDQLLAENGAPLVSKLAGNAQVYGVYSLANRTICLMHDSRGKNQQIYYQILDSDLNSYLPQNGQALDLSDDWQQSILTAEVSPQNTLFLIYSKQEHPNNMIYVQEIDADGNPLYPGNGILLSSSENAFYEITLGFADNSCYIYWTQNLTVPKYRTIVKGQRIVAGATAWEDGGIDIYNNIAKSVHLINAQGSYLIFKSSENAPILFEVRALHIEPSGEQDPNWDPEGVALFNSSNWYDSDLDSHTGLIQDDLYCFVTTSNAENELSLRAQKLAASGTVQWGDNGLQICEYDTYPPILVTVIFGDQISILYTKEQTELYLQKLDTQGNMLFAEDGILMPGLPKYNNHWQLTQYANGAYSYFWRDGDQYYEPNLRHVYINSCGTFQENQFIHKAKFNSLHTVICDNSAVLYWDQRNTDGLSGEEPDINGVYARAFAQPIGNEDITLEPMPMVSLMQNSPNPFSGSTRISYKLHEASPVRLQIFNLKGQLVNELLREPKAAGAYSWEWDGRDTRGHRCAAGIYLYKINTGNCSARKKMVLIK